MPKTTIKVKGQARMDDEFLREAPEVAVFLVCLGSINRLRSLERALSHGELTDQGFFEKFNAVLAQLTLVVGTTERFDVLMPVMDYGCFSPFFWRWFNWWEDYLKGLTAKEIGQIDRLARARKAAVTGYRPDGDWVRYRHTPCFKLVIS